MGLFLVLFWCAAVARGVLRCNSRFGVFNSRLVANKFPFSQRRELVGKRLIWLAAFSAETALFWQEGDNSWFHGNNREFRSRRNQTVAQPAVSAADGLVARRPDRLPGAGHLAADQPRVEPVAGEELVVAAGLDEMSAIQHRQQVGVAHGRQPMGDDDRRAVAHQRVEGAAHLGFADRIEMRCRLVEDR